MHTIIMNNNCHFLGGILGWQLKGHQKLLLLLMLCLVTGITIKCKDLSNTYAFINNTYINK